METEKKEIKHSRGGPVQIYKIDYYHDCPIMVQKIGYSIWQWIMLKWGKNPDAKGEIRENFYQGWILVRPKWYRWFLREPYTNEQKAKIINWCFDAAATTIETLEENEKIKKEKDAGKPEDK